MYYVWSEEGNRPHFKHQTFQGAIEEARRLANQNPGKRFHVILSCGYALKSEAEWHPSEEIIPF